MGTTALVAEKIEGGKRIVRALDEAGFPVRAALWYYRPDTADWRLLIASPIVRESGPNKAYETLQSVLASCHDVALPLTDFWMVKDTEPLVELIRKAISTEERAISGQRFTGNTVNGVFIEDAYIYRSA